MWNMIRCRDQKHSKAVYYSVGENYMIIKDFWKRYTVTNLRILCKYLEKVFMHEGKWSLSFQFHQPTETSKHAKLSGPTC